MGNASAVLSRSRIDQSPEDSTTRTKIKLLIAGGSGVGKTTLFHRLLDQTVPDELTPTTSVNIGAKYVQLKDQRRVMVEVWDLPHTTYAGSAIVDTYINACAAVLIVYDVHDIATWQIAVDYHTLMCTRTTTPMIALVGNKIDSANSSVPPATTQQAHEWMSHQQSDRILHTCVSASLQHNTLALLRSVINSATSRQVEVLPVPL